MTAEQNSTVRPDVKHSPDEKVKVTIYADSDMGMGVSKMEAYLLECGVRKYAQYNSAPYVKYLRKGKRNPSETVKTYNPYLLIVEGWDQPEPHGIYEGGKVVSDSADATVIAGRYGSHDERWDPRGGFQ